MKPIHALEAIERIKTASEHRGREVVVTWHGLRDRANATTTTGESLGVALPNTNGTPLLIIRERQNDGFLLRALSLATIFTIEPVS